MKHARIATYEIKQGSFEEIAEMAWRTCCEPSRSSPRSSVWLRRPGRQDLFVDQPVGDPQERRCGGPRVYPLGAPPR